MKKLILVFALLFGCAFTSCENKTQTMNEIDTIDTVTDSLDSITIEEYEALPSDEYLEDSDYCC